MSIPADHRPRIVLDCDPGHDDAMAIVAAARHTELVGITTVAGNAPLEATTRNALVVADLAGCAHVPIHAGASRPLVAPPKHAGYVHGASGLDGADLPPPSREPDGDDAAAFIAETCRSSEGTWIVATGPLTNVALALRRSPDLAGRIAGISIMGGGTFGNRSAAAEFNIWADPEAADIVLGAGCPVVLAPLDLTHRFQATPPRIEQVRSIGSRLALVLADLLDFFTEGYVRRHEDMEGAAVHDPCAVLALTHPSLFVRRPAHVAIEVQGEHARGMTLIDRRTLRDRPAPNADVLWDLDADAAWSVLVEAVGAVGPVTGE